MSRFRTGSAALCGAGSLFISAAVANACSTNLSLGVGAAAHAATSGCLDTCPPADCVPGGAGLPGLLDSGGRGGLPFEINMAKFAFVPGAPIIRPNTTVRWNNTSLFSQHTSTRIPTWNSGFVNPGQFFDFRFDASRAGLQYQYICQIHFGMEGEINVAHFGDANLDGIVNLQDFNILATNFGSSETNWDQGDFNEDGFVNLQDFNLLAANFGRQIEPAPATLNFGEPLPEPAGGALLWLGALMLGRRRRRKNLLRV